MLRHPVYFLTRKVRTFCVGLSWASSRPYLICLQLVFCITWRLNRMKLIILHTTPKQLSNTYKLCYQTLTQLPQTKKATSYNKNLAIGAGELSCPPVQLKHQMPCNPGCTIQAPVLLLSHPQHRPVQSVTHSLTNALTLSNNNNQTQKQNNQTHKQIKQGRATIALCGGPMK